MKKTSKVYVAGHTGMIGSAVLRELRLRGHENIVTRSRSELDLTNQNQVADFFSSEKPEYVFLCAGKMGGLYANDTYRADFISETLLIETHVIQQAFLNEVTKLVHFGSSSMYPKNCPQPMKEEHLLSGVLDSTIEPFAIAKLAGMKMCESFNLQYGTDFITVIPSNVFGVNQNYEPLNALVIPALIRKYHEAKLADRASVTVMGSGNAVRDFIFADSLARAVLFLVDKWSGNKPINVGSGVSHTVREIAKMIESIVGFRGETIFDPTQSEGALTKLSDLTQLQALGWRDSVSIVDGMRACYRDFLSHTERSNGC